MDDIIKQKMNEDYENHSMTVKDFLRKFDGLPPNMKINFGATTILANPQVFENIKVHNDKMCTIILRELTEEDYQ